MDISKIITPHHLTFSGAAELAELVKEAYGIPEVTVVRGRNSLHISDVRSNLRLKISMDQKTKELQLET